jgi:ABC-type Mn2+/Zn2+ transport system permease subunit
MMLPRIIASAPLHWLTEPFHYEFMQRALLGCVLVGFTNGFLSAFIVLRRLALLADALSHSLLPGLAVGAIFFGLAPLGLFSGAVIAALLVGIGGQLVARSSRLKDETAIGALYTVAFSLGLILLKYSRVPVDLTHFLFGNILGIANSDLWIIYGVGMLSTISLVAFQRGLLLALFEPSVAQSLGVPVSRLNYLLITLIVLAMIASLQAVGVVLSVGLLVLPAATVYLLSDSYRALSWYGGFLGAAGACAGLLLSYWADIPSGPAIVLVLGACFVGALVFGPRYGVLARLRPSRHLHGQSLARWQKTAAAEEKAVT